MRADDISDALWACAVLQHHDPAFVKAAVEALLATPLNAQAFSAQAAQEKGKDGASSSGSKGSSKAGGSDSAGSGAAAAAGAAAPAAAGSSGQGQGQGSAAAALATAAAAAEQRSLAAGAKAGRPPGPLHGGSPVLTCASRHDPRMHASGTPLSSLQSGTTRAEAATAGAEAGEGLGPNALARAAYALSVMGVHETKLINATFA